MGGVRTPVSPHGVKRSMPICQGYDQEDAHEFIRTLLGGLHDRLSCVTTKVPYKELHDIPGESDEACGLALGRDRVCRAS